MKPTLMKSQKISLERILLAAKTEATGAKTSSYILTTAATGFIYLLISAFILVLIPSQFQTWVWLILSFVFALIFSPIRYALEELIIELYPEADYNSHALIKKLNTISYSSLTLNKLSQTFFSELEAGLEITEVAFAFLKSKNEFTLKTNPHFKNISSLNEKNLQAFAETIGHHSQIIHKFTLQSLNQLMRQNHIKMIVPLTNNSELVGMMLLGSKFNQRSYTTKDIKVLDAIAPKIGFAVKNAFTYENVYKKNADLIDELRLTNDDLRQANRRLRHDDKLKDEFFYVATHELKNPITAMKGFLSLISEGTYGQVPEKLQSPLTQIEGSNQQLINLLNNLLEIARAEAQTLELRTMPTTICDTIDSVTADLKPLADQKKIDIVHTCPNPAIQVMADPDRFREIVNNLISNAIKYSDLGMVTISHEIIQDKLVTHIKDQGVGIAEKDQPKIFTRFFRVEEEAAKGIPGSGLGLFIVKQLLEKMGGKISFTSKPNHGSTFSIHLPLAHSIASSRPHKSNG